MRDLFRDFRENFSHNWIYRSQGCQCAHCYSRRVRIAAKISGHSPLMFGTRMHLCSECGNKRCPKATYHKYACTGSNKPGQPGSLYQ